MVTTLALDVGSSSVKCAVLTGTRPVSPLVRVTFKTRYDGVRAEVDPGAILRAVGAAARDAVRQAAARPVDVVALSAMSPSWIALDARGKPLTPVVTHQDRRSQAEAHRIEAAIGRARHIAITGNRPVPGGISSTTAAWFARHERATFRKADLLGHVQTYLIRTLTGSRAMDPSNASFTGLYRTTTADAADPATYWDADLLAAAGVRPAQLPAVLPGDMVAGTCSAEGARLLGVARGTPVLTGVVDTSAAVLLAGALPGMMINVSGSTDVLAVVTEEPRPAETHLTRSLGVAGKFVSVATIPAAGSALAWAKDILFPEMPDPAFFALVARLGKTGGRAKPASALPAAGFDLSLAGSRVSVEQPTGQWTNLRLSTTREEMLAAVVEALAVASAARLPILRAASSHGVRRQVLRTGGTGRTLSALLYRDWKKTGGKDFVFADVPEATLLGLGQLAMGRPV